MRSTPLPLVSTSFTLGRLKVGRYSSLKVGRLHHCPYHGLSASAVAGSFTVEDDAIANLVHLLEVGDLRHARHLFARRDPSAPCPPSSRREILEEARPLVADQIFLDGDPGQEGAEVVVPIGLPSGLERLHPFRISRLVVAFVH